ncbi:hypothetical protein H0H87_010968 [Tephrocybe sp. NHM501043]|nr:hypothetical protein H0H87_010968 [Tephrocybe sp. NHM501043]
MTSVATSQTSTRSNKSTRYGKHRTEGRSGSIEKLAVKTAGLQLEPSMKTASPRPEVPGETLPVLLGHRTRRSRCTPEFLLEMAARDPSEIFEDYGKKLKIITGPDAISFYKQFQRGSSAVEILDVKEGPTPYVVFAVATIDDTGRKRADYYTTWAETDSARDNAEAKRLKHLHSQFRKTARVLDTEFKRASIYGLAASIHAENHIEEEPEKSPNVKGLPPSILIPPPQLKDDGKAPPSATGSVMSLPYLDFVRNVPNTHRIPLRVTNPDARLSIISTLPPASPTTPVKPKQSHLASITEVEPIYIPTPTPFSTPAPAERLLIPETIKKSNSSIRSSRSKESNKSSAASTTSVESHRGKHKNKEIPEFLMILLDERIEKDTRTWHGLERQVSRSTTRTSSRISGWDGPLARETGRSFIHPARPDGDESSEEEDDWETGPVIPTIPFFNGISRSFSEPHHHASFHPLPSHLQRYGFPASLGSSPIGSFANLGYGPSPLLPNAPPMIYPHSPHAPKTYASPYHSPTAPLMRTMSRSSYQPPFQQS